MIAGQQFGQQNAVARRITALHQPTPNTQFDLREQASRCTAWHPVLPHVTRSVPVWVRLPPAPQSSPDQRVHKIPNHDRIGAGSRWAADRSGSAKLVTGISRIVIASSPSCIAPYNTAYLPHESGQARTGAAPSEDQRSGRRLRTQPAACRRLSDGTPRRFASSCARPPSSRPPRPCSAGGSVRWRGSRGGRGRTCTTPMRFERRRPTIRGREPGPIYERRTE